MPFGSTKGRGRGKGRGKGRGIGIGRGRGRGKRVRDFLARRPTTLLGKRVIGIDLATTRSCVASSAALWDDLERLNDNKTQPPNVEVFSGWPRTGGGLRTNPVTALYYQNPHQLPMTGNDLDTILRQRSQLGSTSFDTERLFRLWKLMFHDDQNDPSIKALQADMQRKLDRLNLTTFDLLRGWVASTYATLFEKTANGEVKLSIPDERIMEIEVVVAVPPGRSVIAHEEVLQAFIQGPIQAHSVSLVSEPEALFRSWIADGSDSQHWKVGQTYLVCDGGGATCCLVRFRLDRLNPLGFTQEFESESIICGAELISNAFEDLAATQVPSDMPHRAWVLDNLRRQFDGSWKRSFGEEVCDGLEYCFEKPWNRNQSIVFSREQIAACFDKCIEKLIDGIRRQLQRGRLGQTVSFSRNSTPVNCLVLGGGLFENKYVMNRIKDEFPSLKICELSKDPFCKKHVARGAVLTRLCDKDDFITRRPILRSKAVLTLMQVTDAIRKSSIGKFLDSKKDERNGLEYFWAAQWLVKQGDDSGLKHANDHFELSSESSPGQARTRAFDLHEQNLKFCETILTVNYRPGKATWAALRKEDHRLIDMDGNLIPEYISDEITWDPHEFGLPIGSLEVEHPPNKDPFRILRYSIQLRLKEVETLYWIKAYFWDAKTMTFDAVTSTPKERKTLLQSHEISQLLSQSRELGRGIRLEGNSTSDNAAPLKPHQINQPTELPQSSRRTTHSTQELLESASVSKEIPIAQKSQLISDPSMLNSRRAQPSLATSDFLAIPKKRPAPTEAAGQAPSKALRSPMNIRPTQRQSTDSSGEYSLGAMRNNGGCWTCAFRNLKCNQENPDCTQCSKVGVVCEYGRPIWWYDEGLKEAQRKINKDLIKEKALTSSKALSAARKTNTSRTKAMKPILSIQTSKARVDPHHSKAFQPTMVAHPEMRHSVTLSPVTKGFQTEVTQEEDCDLYGASPPPQKQHALQKENTELGGYVRRSNRPRVRSIATDKIFWDEIDVDIGLYSEPDTTGEDSNEAYVVGSDY